MLWRLKQAIIWENLLSTSKINNNLVRTCIAGNAKNKRNWPTLPRNFSATAGTKNFKPVPKLVLGYVLYVHILLVEFWEGARRIFCFFFPQANSPDLEKQSELERANSELNTKQWHLLKHDHHRIQTVGFFVLRIEHIEGFPHYQLAY